MALFKRRKSQFSVEEPAEVRFNAMMDLVKDLSQKDYNRLKKAMDLSYKGYQTVRGLEASDEASQETGEFMLYEKEEK